MQKSTRALLTAFSVVLCAALVGGCSVKAKTARHQQRADNYYAAGDLSKAEVEYLITLRWDSNNKRAMSQLGDIYFQQGRYGRAFAFVQRAAEMSTNDVNVQLKLANIYLMVQKNQEARNAAEYVLTLSPTNTDAPDILAESAVTKPDIMAARKWLEAHQKKTGETAPMLLAFGILDYASGDEKAAETELQRSLTLNPKYSAAHYTVGILNLRRGMVKEADAEFKQAADLSPVRSPRRLSYANFKLQTGDVAEGKRLLEQISKEAPDYVPAWIRQAEVALEEKRYEDCNSMLDKALVQDSDNFDALFLRGRMYLVTSKIDKAVAEFSRMGALYDQAPEVQYQLALAEVGAKDQAKAAAALNKALFLRPKYPDAIMLLAGLNINVDPAAAVRSLTQLIREYPRLAQAYILMGNAYLAQKDYDSAYTTFLKAQEMLPQNPQMPLLIGLTLEQKKNPIEARKAFERAVQLAPDLLRAWEELVDLDLVDGKFSAALDRLNTQTDEKLGPTREVLLAKTYLARAQSIAAKENPNASTLKLTSPAVQPDVNLAEKAMLKAIDLSPDQPIAYVLLSQLYVASGREQTALDRLNGYVSKTNSASAYMQIGVIYDSKKDYAKARDAYEKVLSINPDFRPALNNLSYLYCERLNDPAKAYPLAKKVVDLAPDNPAVLDTLGWITYKKGDYAHARTMLENSASKMVGNAEVQFHVGMVRYMMGDENLARQALQEAAASKAEFPGKEEAGRRLATLAIDAKTANEKTLADLEQRLKDEPNDPVAATRIGELYERNGSVDKAVKIYEQLLKQDPQSGAVMAHLARDYMQLNQTDKALAMAKEAHKALPADVATSALLGKLVFASGDYNFSANLLEDAASKLPNQPEVRYQLAWAYYGLGRVDDALRTMQSAASSLTGSQLSDAKQFVTFVAAAKDPAQAAALPAAQILATNADYVPAMIVAAVQAEKQGKPDDAAQYYTKALARYPAFASAARSLAIVASKNPSGNLDQKVYDLAMKMRASDPKDSDLTRALGVLTYRRADYPRAVQLLQDSSQTLSKDGEVFYFLGMSQYQLKRPLPAKQALQQALALNVSTKYADDAKKVLQELK